jgi:murein DD-endopeptidase MepM/ murein hydrolase activator NlpD
LGNGVIKQEFESGYIIWNSQTATVYLPEIVNPPQTPNTSSPKLPRTGAAGLSVKVNILDSEIVNARQTIEKQEELIRIADQTIAALTKENEEIINPYLQKKQSRIDEIKSNVFWWLWPGNHSELSELDKDIALSRGQKKLNEDEKKKIEENKKASQMVKQQLSDRIKQDEQELQKYSHYIQLSKMTNDRWDWIAGENTRITGVEFPGAEIDDRTYLEHVWVLKLYSELSAKLLRSPLESPYPSTAGYIDVSYGDDEAVGWHDGIDISTNKKILNVHALVGGTVRKLSYSGNKDVGEAVVIEGDDGRYYHYLHLHHLDIASGRIEADQVIGQVGDNSYYRLSHHLHFQVNTSAKTDEGSAPYQIHNKADVKKYTLNPLKVFWEHIWNGN